MFEKETKFISDFNINKIRKLGAFFTLDGLASARIHPAIFQYISAELDYLIYLDRKRIIKQSVFDYTLPEVSPHFVSIAAAIKKNKLLPFEEIKNLVIQAVQFNIHLLLQPRRTLTRFIYEEYKQKSAEEVLLLLSYLSYYDFYRKIISEYIEKKNILTFQLDDFEVVLSNLNKLLIESQTQAMMDTALTSMADFFNAGDVNKTLIPLGAVELFLKEKGLSVYISKIRTILSTDVKSRFEVEDYKNAMYSNIAISLDRDFREKLQQEMQDEAEDPSLKSISRGSFSFSPITENPANSADSNIARGNYDSVQKEETISLDELLGLKSRKSENTTRVPESTASDIYQKASTFTDAQIEETIQPESDSEEQQLSSVHNEFNPETEVKPPFHLRLPDDVLADNEEKAIDSDAIGKRSPNDSEGSGQVNFGGDSPDKKMGRAAPSINPGENEKPKPVSDFRVDEPAVVPDKQPEEELAEDKITDDLDATRDLFSYFSTRETMRIVEEVFNNDSLDFVSTMESIAECENLDQAYTLVKSVFYSYKINSLNNREAKLLLSKIEEFFGSGK